MKVTSLHHLHRDGAVKYKRKWQLKRSICVGYGESVFIRIRRRVFPLELPFSLDSFILNTLSYEAIRNPQLLAWFVVVEATY
jgi:hypothetical protein